ncbi:MAG: energy-coupling factor transporter transmembrane component T [Eubacteriales bacterium]|nr:energy-coupling factor transporter transmembrane component T [Eubacteriales bacterium]
MIRDMTLGQYYKGDSVIHRLDARVKLMGTLLFVVTLFLPKSPAALLSATLFLAGVTALSKVPLSMLIRGVKPLLFLIIFSAGVNLLFTPGETIVQWGFLRITKEGLRLSIYLVIRLVYLVVGSSIMTFTTTPGRLADGLEKSLGFLTKVRIPVHELAMMISIALRFIPVLTEELDKIMKAQMSRGADFESGSLMQRARQMIPILVPLFVSSIRRASDLALAMDARCYNGGIGRTKLKPLRYEKRDYAAYGVLGVYTVWMAGCAFFLRA